MRKTKKKKAPKTLTLADLDRRIKRLEKQMREVSAEAQYAYDQTMPIGSH